MISLHAAFAALNSGRIYKHSRISKGSSPLLCRRCCVDIYPSGLAHQQKPLEIMRSSLLDLYYPATARSSLSSLSLYANRKMEVRRTRSPASVCLNMLVSYVKWQSGRRRRRRQLGTAASTSSSCSAETSSFAADGRYAQKDKKRIYCIASAVRCAYVL